jgi:hypothetical protein
MAKILELVESNIKQPIWTGQVENFAPSIVCRYITNVKIRLIGVMKKIFSFFPVEASTKFNT